MDGIAMFFNDASVCFNDASVFFSIEKRFWFFEIRNDLEKRFQNSYWREFSETGKHLQLWNATTTHFARSECACATTRPTRNIRSYEIHYQAARPLAKRKFRKVRTWKGDRRLPKTGSDISRHLQKASLCRKAGWLTSMSDQFHITQIHKVCQTRSSVLHDPPRGFKTSVVISQNGWQHILFGYVWRNWYYVA